MRRWSVCRRRGGSAGPCTSSCSTTRWPTRMRCGNSVDTIRELTQWYTTRLEEIIRRAPDQYWWLHRRWKDTRPKRHEKKRRRPQFPLGFPAVDAQTSRVENRAVPSRNVAQPPSAVQLAQYSRPRLCPKSPQPRAAVPHRKPDHVSPSLPRYCWKCCVIALLVGAEFAVSVAAESGTLQIGPGKNVALGAKYELSPAPNYQHCTDPGDLVQLTDGKTTKDYFLDPAGHRGLERGRLCHGDPRSGPAAARSRAFPSTRRPAWPASPGPPPSMSL